MSLESSLQSERSTDTLFKAGDSKVSQIRRRLFHGDALSAAAVVRDYGVSNGLLGITIRELRQLGYDFVEGKEINDHGQEILTYAMTNPDHWPSEEDFRRVTNERTAKQRISQRKKRAEKREQRASEPLVEPYPLIEEQSKPKRRGKLPLPVLPQLGSDLRVVMIRIDEESGAAYIGLKNGTVSWEVLIEAQN